MTQSPAPEETPGEEIKGALGDVWDVLSGTPLRIALILLVSVIVLMILRRLIKTLSEKIATGGDGYWEPTSEKGKALKNAVNPLANVRRAQRSRTIGSVLRSVASLVIGATALLMIMVELGINIAPLLASAGVVGVAIGFGAQSLVKDFLSGMFLILEDQYGVGDKVTIGDVNGTVESIALRITKVRDAEGTLWYLRNGDVLKVGNKTHGWAVASVEVKVPFNADLEQVRAALKAAAETVKHDKKLSSAIRGDAVVSGIETMAFGGLTVKVNVKTQPARQWDVNRALRENIRSEFAQRELELAE